MTRPGEPVTVPRDGTRDLRLAWVGVALVPVSFVAAMVLGEWLLSLRGYDSAEADVALVDALAAGLPALAVLAVPPACAIWFGRRAQRAGRDNGRVPVIVGIVLLVLAVGSNGLSLVARLFE